MTAPSRTGSLELVGLIPAAGEGSRVSPLPCSKEVFPIGYREVSGDGAPRPKVAAHHLLEKMRLAGARKAIVVLRDGKWDIPSYFGNGEIVDLELAYVVMRRPHGVPFSVDDAHGFLRGKQVLFGFPDILFRPENVYARLLEKKRTTGADLVVAVFPVHRPEKTDMVELGPDGEIVGWDTGSEVESFDYTWVAAAWGPAFTEHLHRFVGEEASEVEASGGSWHGREMSMGDVLWDAVQGGLRVGTVLVEEGSYIDIGTPDDLAAAASDYGSTSSSGASGSHPPRPRSDRQPAGDA